MCHYGVCVEQDTHNVHVPDERRRKLDPKVEKCIFIGYAQNRKAYKCYNPNTRHVVILRDVVFDEPAS